MRLLLPCATLLAAGAGCMGNQSGDFAASRTGDLSNPLAERRAPDEELVAACGDGRPIDGAALAPARLPYLQQLSAAGTHVLWTGDPAGAPELRAAAAGTAELSSAGVLPTAEVDGAVLAGGLREYEAAMSGLGPDAIYCYSLYSGEQPLLDRAGFRTAPLPGAGARVTFAAFGDSGYRGADQTAILEQLGTVPFRLMLHTGDIAYESGTMAELEDTFFSVYAPLLQSFAMFPARGNHDDLGVFQQVFSLPGGSGRTWYSFDHGDVHFVALDTNDIGPAQAAWLDADLAATEREWIVVYGHHPPYSSGEHGSSTAFRTTFGPILEKHRVDLVLSGHDHDYERIAPQNGVHYLVTGGGGRGTRPVGSSEFTAFAEQVLHFVYVEVEGDRLLLHAIDGEGSEFDQLLIQH